MIWSLLVEPTSLAENVAETYKEIATLWHMCELCRFYEAINMLMKNEWTLDWAEELVSHLVI